MNYDSPTNLPLRIAVVAIIALWRCWQMTRRRPTTASLIITVAILGSCGSLIFEAIAHAQSRAGTGRVYIMLSLQVICLAIMLVALCAYYAVAADTRQARNLVLLVASIGFISCGIALGLSFQVAPGRELWDFQHSDTLRWYFASTLFFPVATAVGGLLAARSARRAFGALRVALGMAAAGLWLLAAVGIVTPISYWNGRNTPDSLATVGPPGTVGEPLKTFIYVGFNGGCVLVVISWAAVAIAHRARQLREIRDAWRDTRDMRKLRDDLSTVAPELSFPRTGWTPLLLKPHAARMTALIECRDRLITLSPRLAAELNPEEYQNPRSVAAALQQLRGIGALHQPSNQVQAVPILTDSGAYGRDQLISLARSYSRQGKETSAW
ncbi:DUF6545 domain-containing protein [Nocardia arthritidis]|uniref:Uncharacterized protein n=1 Tax=Nocardia arthritidis TaxID=228602 RepID=A0A6G9YL61_9NOCA|nr:DUF6545 domain-containing protein [Nocardia arthritidis]QIS13952.1 hypothetical protein F5544_30545 [Nocardia arthritidis]